MNQLIAVALGGACGAVVRFLMSTGLYHSGLWGFPYGTLAVNVVGSFLIGLLTEALICNASPFRLITVRLSWLALSAHSPPFPLFLWKRYT